MKYSVSFLLAIASTPLLANSPIETISVLGSRSDIEQYRVAGAVTVLDESTIRASGAAFLSELLRMQAGFAVSQAGGSGALTELRVRGSETNHVLVLVDGVAINDVGQGGLVDFGHLTLDDVIRIEILRGPQSALWGNGALAAVISITTTQATARRISLSAGQDESYRAAINWQQQFDTILAGLNVSAFKTSGSNLSFTGSEPDGHRNTSINGNLQWQISDAQTVSFSARQRLSRSDFDSVDYLSGYPADSDDYTDVSQQGAQMMWRYEGQVFSHQLALNWQRNQNDSVSNNQSNGQNHSQTGRGVLQTTWHYRDENALTFAWELAQERFTQRGEVSAYGDPNQQQQNTIRSVIIDWQHALSSNLTLTASGRYDDNQVFANSRSYKLGASTQLNPQWRVYLSQGVAVKNPSFVERFGYYQTSLYPFIGNPDLAPERSFSREVGAHWQRSELAWQVSWFDASLDNEIDGFYYDSALAATTAINKSQQSSRQGVETSLNWHTDLFHLQTSYTYLDAREEDAFGVIQPELRRPRHTGSVQLSVTPINKLTVVATAAYNGSHQDLFFPPEPPYQQRVDLAAYWLVNMNLHYALTERLGITIRAENLLNRQYQDLVGYRGQPQRWFAGINVNL